MFASARTAYQDEVKSGPVARDFSCGATVLPVPLVRDEIQRSTGGSPRNNRLVLLVRRRSHDCPRPPPDARSCRAGSRAIVRTRDVGHLDSSGDRVDCLAVAFAKPRKRLVLGVAIRQGGCRLCGASLARRGDCARMSRDDRMVLVEDGQGLAHGRERKAQGHADHRRPVFLRPTSDLFAFDAAHDLLGDHHSVAADAARRSGASSADESKSSQRRTPSSWDAWRAVRTVPAPNRQIFPAIRCANAVGRVRRARVRDVKASMKRSAIAPAIPLRQALVALALGVASIAAHAGGTAQQALPTTGTPENQAVRLRAALALDSTTEDRILALDPEALSASDVRDILSLASAPRIIALQGSIPLITMQPFAEFLIAMGYPERQLA